jgi:hypothetical protein
MVGTAKKLVAEIIGDGTLAEDGARPAGGTSSGASVFGPSAAPIWPTATIDAAGKLFNPSSAHGQGAVRDAAGTGGAQGLVGSAARSAGAAVHRLGAAINMKAPTSANVLETYAPPGAFALT